MSIAIWGLAIDVLGVLILGIDLFFLQSRLRNEAQDRLDSVQMVLDNHANTEDWLSDIAKQADWRDGDVDEGRWMPQSGSFDHRAAQSSFEEMSETVAALAADLKVLAKLNYAAVSADRKTANRSIWLTALGLSLIVLGFVMQAVAAIS